MQRYNIDSESDDEETDTPMEPKSSLADTQWTLDDIEKFKAQTALLLDPNWKLTRHKLMIQKMLDLEHPVVTSKMVDYLLQDGVCEVLVGFITLNGTNLPRPGLNDAFSEEIKLAYRAALLLSPEVITDPLSAVLSKKAGIIIRKLFDIFKDDSSGSFYHAYRVLECLLRCFPAESLSGLYDDGCLHQRIVDMLKYVGYSPVAEIFLIVVTLTPISRADEVFLSIATSRQRFLKELQDGDVLCSIVKALIDPSSVQAVSPMIDTSLHPSACCQMFQDLMEKLSLEDMGNTLLESFKSNAYIIQSLIEAMINKEALHETRQCCAKILGFLLRRAAEPEIVCFVSTNATSPPVPTYLPNYLYSYRENIVTAVRGSLADIIESISSLNSDDVTGVKYSSYAIEKPFTVLRHLLIEVLVLTVESDDTAAESIPLELWSTLLTWIVRYPHNNIYHALFYRLIFAVLRQGKELPQTILFEKANFVQFLNDNFVLDASVDNRSECFFVRGLLMNCGNAIRLQMSTQTSGNYLNSILSGHIEWKSFLPKLGTATDEQMKFGMGLKVTNDTKQPNIIHDSSTKDEADQHQRFAKSLGFYDEADWSLGIKHA